MEILNEYSFGGSSFKRRLGVVLLWLSRRCAKFSLRARKVSWRLFKWLSNNGKAMEISSKCSTINKLKVTIQSPRTTMHSFYIDGQQQFLFTNYPKTPDSTANYIAFSKGELEIKTTFEEYSYVRSRIEDWLD